MHLQIVKSLDNAPATGCVSLNAEHAKERREKVPSRPQSEGGFLGKRGANALFWLLFEPAGSALRVRRREEWDASMTSAWWDQGCAPRYTLCEIR